MGDGDRLDGGRSASQGQHRRHHGGTGNEHTLSKEERVLEQVSDTRSALTFLSAHPQVEPGKIALLGSSFGAAVAIYTAGVDARAAAVVSSGGWGNGERKFRGQHPTPEAWAKFTAMLEEGKRHRARTGKSLMVPRYDIVPIPEHMRGHVAPGSIQMFPAETAHRIYDFPPPAVFPNIAPR